VSATTTVTVNFDEPMAPATINSSTIFLRDASQVLVSAAVSYNAATFQATLTPSAALAAGATYTVTVRGGAPGVKDLAGNPLANDYVSSFSTFAQPPTGIWDDSAVPAILADADTNATELGLKFRSAVSGYVTGCDFTKARATLARMLATCGRRTGTLLASVTFANETSSGWQYQAFPEPVPISANTTYVVSYHAPVGRYSKTEGLFTTSGVTNQPLWALANGADGPNGVYRYGPSGFPTETFNSTHYWVDVSFSQFVGPDIYPPVVVSVNPPSGGSAPGIGSVVKVTFDEPILAATINASTFTLRNALNQLGARHRVV
jgi:hypothetical protein